MEDSVAIEILQGRVERLIKWIADSTIDDPADYDKTTRRWAEELEALQWALARVERL